MYFFSLFFRLLMLCTYGSEDEEDEVIWNVQCHYAQAKIDNCILSLGDCAYIMVKALFFMWYPLNAALTSFFFLCCTLFII